MARLTAKQRRERDEVERRARQARHQREQEEQLALDHLTDYGTSSQMYHARKQWAAWLWRHSEARAEEVLSGATGLSIWNAVYPLHKETGHDLDCACMRMTAAEWQAHCEELLLKLAQMIEEHEASCTDDTCLLCRDLKAAS